MIRELQSTDWDAISEIYRDGIATGLATFETEVPEWHVWNEKYSQVCRLVAIEDQKVIGFAVLSAASKRKVYKGVAEVSVYVDKAFRSQGIGKELLQRLINESETHGYWMLQAAIFPQNVASTKMHEQCGFRIVGIREKIGKRNGVWFDNCFMERRSKIIGIE